MAFSVGSGDKDCSGNPLDAARAAFRWLTAGNHPVSLDGRLFDHLPDREIPVDELRDLLLEPGCPRWVWDQVWTHVICRARREGGTWTITAVGLALPMLTTLSARLTERYANDPSDIVAEIVRGFLDALATLDLAEGRIAVRLRWAAYRAGHRALLDGMDGPRPRPPGLDANDLASPCGHPDLVLARAVEVGVVSRTEAEVISETRLGDMLLNDWAAHHEIEFWAAYKTRKRAECRLAGWLAKSDMSSDDGDPTRRAATMWPTCTDVTANADPSRHGAKKVGQALSNQAPNFGLQGRG